MPRLCGIAVGVIGNLRDPWVLSLSPLLPADTLELEGGKRRGSLWSIVRLRWTAFLGPLSTDTGNDK